MPPAVHTVARRRPIIIIQWSSKLMETGKFVAGPTVWPLARWSALLEGERLQLPEAEALDVRSLCLKSHPAPLPDPALRGRPHRRDPPATPLEQLFGVRRCQPRGVSQTSCRLLLFALRRTTDLA